MSAWKGFGPKPKMTVDKVRGYRIRHADGATYTSLAQEEGVSLSTMSRAVRGLTPSYGPLEPR